MIIVSDTSPINYLVLIGEIDVLPQLLGRVIIPRAVFAELQAEKTPEIVKQFIADLPDWIEIAEAKNGLEIELTELDAGERDAIALAEELGADALLMDEKSGREAALKRSLPVVGTLGILERAAEKNLIDFPATLKALKSKGFFVAPALEQSFLARDFQRKNA
jgi:predicted nucleic acid-binding protein